MFNRWRTIRSRRGLFSVGVSVILVLILLLLAQPFFSRMLENLERTAVQQIVRQLNSAAQFKMAEYVALDKLNLLPEQIGVNPVAWLDINDLGGWNGYQGEVNNINFGQLEVQQWVFDKLTRRLVYKVKYPELLNNQDPQNNRIQFRVEMDFVDFNNDGNFDAKTDTINGLIVMAVYPYQWQQREQ